MTLRDIISFNKGFKSGINLYLSLNKEEKIRSYIPTASSLRILDDYLQAALQNKEQATLLIGPYGKGKSHLLLVLLAILSMERNEKNAKIIEEKSAEEIKSQKENMIHSSKNEIAELAVNIAEKILERETNEEDTKRIINDFFDEANI